MSVLLPAICIHQCSGVRCSNSGPICPDHYTDRVCRSCQDCSVYHENNQNERQNPHPFTEVEEGYDSDNSLYEPESSISLNQDEPDLNNDNFIDETDDEFENIFDNDFNSDDTESE